MFNGSTFAYGCFLVRRRPTNWNVPTPSAASQQTVATMLANITEWVGRRTVGVPDPRAVALRAGVPKEDIAIDPGDD